MIDKETLSVKLTELGIKHDGRMTADKLFELLPESEKEAFVQATPAEPVVEATGTPVETVTPAETTPDSPVDFSKLTQNDLRALKSMLNSTPLTSQNVEEKTATIRKFNDKYVVDSKPQRMTTHLDPVEQRAVTKHIIPIRYHGETDFVEVDWVQLMRSERVVCKIKNVRAIKGIIEEGVVFSQERKVEVPQVVHTIKQYFSLELPGGEVIEVFENVINGQ